MKKTPGGGGRGVKDNPEDSNERPFYTLWILTWPYGVIFILTLNLEQNVGVDPGECEGFWQTNEGILTSNCDPWWGF